MFGLRLRPELLHNALDELIDPEGPQLSPYSTGVKFRKVEQTVELFLKNHRGVLDPAQQSPRLVRRHVKRQGAEKHRESVEWLAQIVACRREEPALGFAGQPQFLKRLLDQLLLRSQGVE